MVQRDLRKIIGELLFKKKTIVIYGARQTGKTTLAEALVKQYREETIFLNGDDGWPPDTNPDRQVLMGQRQPCAVLLDVVFESHFVLELPA